MMFESYETIGALFREITAQTVELSITEKIWELIQHLVSVVADFFSADFDELLTNIINENKQLKGGTTTNSRLNHLRNLSLIISGMLI